MIGCLRQWRAGLMNHKVFQCDAKKTQYSNTPLFHHSNCERSEPVLPLDHQRADIKIIFTLTLVHFIGDFYDIWIKLVLL
jgi:hypothetical protein